LSEQRDWTYGSRVLFPVSAKGVLLGEEGVVLLENERGQWELPGGKLEIGESPEECLAREIREELDLEPEIGPLLDAFVYEVLPGVRVLVLAYGCFTGNVRGVSHSAEHSDVGIFGLDELGMIELPEGYARSVRIWSEHPTFRGRPSF
jgi:8-oxo-dGTP pyrophosphatase MutT (NUDIX family)